MEDYERPSIRTLVAFPVRPDLWGEPFVVSLELAAELVDRGWMILVDPQDERDLAMWEIAQRAMNQPRKWFESR